MTTSLLLAFGQTAGWAQGSEEKETKLKAAFVLKFAMFVEWPDSAFASPTNPIVFGVLGRDPFGTILDATMQAHGINRRPLEVKRPRNLEEAMGCHVLFISTSERERVRSLLPLLKARSILTVSDMEGFTEAQGMIGLKRKQGAMRFDINRRAAEEAGIKISSQLLKLADGVH